MFRVWISGFLVLSSISAGSACECVQPPPPNEAAQKAVAVFSGKVTDFKLLSPSYVEVTFEVMTSWKGVQTRTINVVTGTHEDNCGYKFDVGKEYLVYCFSKDKKLGTNICTRTKVLKQADEDLKALGAGQAPVQETPEKAE